MPHAKLVYLSDAPKGLPSVFPIGLDGVRPDITDLWLEYDEASTSLRVVIVLAESVNPSHENPGAAFDDLVVGLVDHVSFELGLPIQSPKLISYNDPLGSVTVYPQPLPLGVSLDAILVQDSNVLKAKLSVMFPVSNLLQEYNAAAHIDNPVQQFVALWGILTYLAVNGTVRAVEAFLHTLGVKDETVAGPRRPETKYARVRSEIAHPADRGVRLADLPARVNTVLPEFRQVVRKAVAAHVGLP
jgi:hypothetical protein